ncbi:WAT1-related protein [Cardamine amara subsp. amara]|uniref:WAT1-related protein n=1 Tax=Cardamine amara subsp. amara TaxID=228776 RepID=A0ABD1AWC3_CARAN
MEMSKYKAVLALVMLQFLSAGVALFTKAAFMEGLSPTIFVVYRQVVATLFIFPISFLSAWRKENKPSLGVRGFWWVAFTAVIGVSVNQNAYFKGIDLSSSSMACAMTNLIPAVTFIISIIVGFESIRRRSMKSAAKVIGTGVCVGGAMAMTFLRGPKLLNALLNQDKNTWLLGCFFLLISTFAWSLWLILQLAVSFFLQAWAVSEKGPLFSALFNPLSTVIVTFFGALYLKEQTYLGSLLGALAVILGLYIVLWGKSEDYQEEATNLKLQNEHTTASESDFVPIMINDKAFRSSELLEPLLM